MKNTFSILCFSLISVCGISQSNLDSLSIVREELVSQKNQLEKQIEEVEKKIITEILTDGYEMTIKSSYRGQTYDLKVSNRTPEITILLADGNKVTVLGMESIYYKVKFGEDVGLVFFANPDFPISLLKEYKYKDHIEGKGNYKKSSLSGSSSSSTSTKSSDCSSTQCTGHTQKGSRCRNMTTNCSGRCHLH